ncbi:MAG: hypothetical protein QM666_04015 [Acinetobacter sp.]
MIIRQKIMKKKAIFTLGLFLMYSGLTCPAYADDPPPVQLSNVPKIIVDAPPPVQLPNVLEVIMDDQHVNITEYTVTITLQPEATGKIQVRFPDQPKLPPSLRNHIQQQAQQISISDFASQAATSDSTIKQQPSQNIKGELSSNGKTKFYPVYEKTFRFLPISQAIFQMIRPRIDRPTCHMLAQKNVPIVNHQFQIIYSFQIDQQGHLRPRVVAPVLTDQILHSKVIQILNIRSSRLKVFNLATGQYQALNFSQPIFIDCSSINRQSLK